MEQYIPKSALLLEIEKRQRMLDLDNPLGRGGMVELQVLKNKLDSIEVKDVDLEKVIKEEYLKCRCYGGKNNMLVILSEPQFNEIAKYFFELSLNVT